MLRVAHSMEMLGEPWPDVQDAYLRAWEFRPTRAEPLYALARRYANENRHRLGYLFAERAAEIPPPEDDMIVPHPDLYAWRAAEVQAICAYYIGKQAEAFTLCRRLLARPDILDGDRQRIAGNRDVSVPTMLEAASSYPDLLARNLIAGPHDAEVTVSLVAGADRAATEQTLNSFLHCCTDVSRVGRFLMIDAGLSAQDRAILHERYEFLDFADYAAAHSHSATKSTDATGCIWGRAGGFSPPRISSRDSSRCSTPKHKCSRSESTSTTQSRSPASAHLNRRCAERPMPAATSWAKRWPEARRCSTPHDWVKPAVWTPPTPIPITELGRCAAAAGLQTASLDEVLCITAV